MRVQEEFSRYAANYDSHNVIQSKVAQKLIDDTVGEPKNIVDLGCGSGTVFSTVSWQIEHFIGIDFSAPMLSMHPVSPECEVILGDFNDPSLFKYLAKLKIDHLYSASALQWANDLDTVFYSLSALKIPFSLAIFTSGTFRTLYATAGLPPLLKSSEELIAIVSRHITPRFETVRYTLKFDSVRDMFRYIKRSGVSGGRRLLSFTQTKNLMKRYPLEYLEFEVLFIASI